MNFDQLAIRTSWSAYSGFHVGRTGFFRSRILVLDEATSSLDSESEAAIQDALDVRSDTAFRCASALGGGSGSCATGPVGRTRAGP